MNPEGYNISNTCSSLIKSSAITHPGSGKRMTFISSHDSAVTVNLTPAVNELFTAFKSLSVDDQLGLLWMIYHNLGCSLTPIPPGAARLFLTQGLLHRIKQMAPTDQLTTIRDLMIGADTAIARQYGLFVPTTKLAFWHQLFEWMSMGDVVPIAAGCQLSPEAALLFKKVASLALNEQSALVCCVVTTIGIAPIVVEEAVV